MPNWIEFCIILCFSSAGWVLFFRSLKTVKELKEDMEFESDAMRQSGYADAVRDIEAEKYLETPDNVW